MSLRKSSSRRKGSKSVVLPKPKARRRCTPAPSRVGLALTRRLMGRMDIAFSCVQFNCDCEGKVTAERTLSTSRRKRVQLDSTATILPLRQRSWGEVAHLNEFEAQIPVPRFSGEKE